VSPEWFQVQGTAVSMTDVCPPHGALILKREAAEKKAPRTKDQVAR
jgi:hypothetical protein